MMFELSQNPDWHYAATDTAFAAIEPEAGRLRDLTFKHGGRQLVPLHKAHWVTDNALDTESAMAVVERGLAGDFFCAPFGANDVEGGPPHGWSANGHWTLKDSASDRLSLTLDRPVMGARIEKQLRLAADAPLVYQTHLIRGGEGGLSVAHHPMVRLRGTGRFCTSPKKIAITPDRPLEEGRHALACPAQASDIRAFPGSDGRPVDLTRLPIAEHHEDFVSLLEAPASSLGWSAVVRDVEDDIVFFLKDPGVLPVTGMWHSNAGRDYYPWDGRHTGVVGIEDGCAADTAGHAAALSENALSAHGVRTFLPLAAGRVHRVAHVIGAIARPRGWDRVTGVSITKATLTISGPGASTVELAFLPGFFEG